MSYSFRLGRLFGIPIYIHISWFIIFALVTLSLSGLYFPSVYPNWSSGLYLMVGVATSLLFFASVVAHELTHSLVSRLNGVPVKSITLFIFGGMARITREASQPMAELVMAAAGPASSLVLAGLFGLLWWLIGSYSEPISALAGWLLRINILLAVFNMVPGFPLDGGRVLRSLLWRLTGNYTRATRLATLAGRGVGYILISAGILLVILTRDWFGGVWLAFIGWFLDNAASTSYQQAMLRESLKEFSAREVMTQDCPTIPGDMTVGQLVRDNVLPSGRRCFLVVDWGRLEGIITLGNIKSVRRELWEATPLSQVMTPMERLQIARPVESAVSVLERMEEKDINQMPVVEEGRVIGMILRDSLIHFVRTRSELGA
jgi:Zn-dependent protease